MSPAAMNALLLRKWPIPLFSTLLRRLVSADDHNAESLGFREIAGHHKLMGFCIDGDSACSGIGLEGLDDLVFAAALFDDADGAVFATGNDYRAKRRIVRRAIDAFADGH